MSECVVKMKKPLVCITKDGYHGNCPMDRVWCIQRNAPKGITMGEAYAAMTDKVPSWCPVVCQLPEGHGRLVDADLLANNMNAKKAFYGMSMVEHADTIVPAAERSET